MTKLVILDRDGVINYDSQDYIKSVDEFHLIPGSVDAISKLTKAGYHIGIATNQSGIARGLYDHQTLESIHGHLMEQVQSAGGRIDIIKYCSHMPESGCPNRKPAPGMLKDIALYFGVELTGVPYVGDRITDIIAAKSVGAIPYLIRSSMTNMDELSQYPDVPTFSSLLELVEQQLVNR